MSTARVSRGSALVALACALGCNDSSRGPEFEARAGIGPRREATTNRSRRASEYELSPTSRVELELGPPGQHAVGHVALVRGRIWVDPAALDEARAQLTFDVMTLDLGTEPTGASPRGPASDPRTLTEQSLDWLEIRDPKLLAGHPEQRYADFSLLQLHSADGNDARAAPAVPASRPGAAARRVRSRATGELELHGVRLPYTGSLLALFEWADSTLAGPAQRIELSTAEAIAIDPLGHDLVPRDGRGDVSSEALALMRRQPSRAVRIGLRWTAELAHTGTDGLPR